MIPAKVSALRSVEIGCTELAPMLRFFTEVWNLLPVGEDKGTHLLRGSGAFHHILALRALPQTALVRMVFDAADRATVDGHLTKWLGRDDVDGSLSALVGPLGWVDPASPVAKTTVEAVDATLADDVGVHRFADDVFYGGGRWPLLTAFHGLAKLAAGDRDGAVRALDWIVSTASADGLLPEQVSDRLLAPDALAGWTDRWGPVATPLLWSHGEFLRLWDALGRP